MLLHLAVQVVPACPFLQAPLEGAACMESWRRSGRTWHGNGSLRATALTLQSLWQLQQTLRRHVDVIEGVSIVVGTS